MGKWSVCAGALMLVAMSAPQANAQWREVWQTEVDNGQRQEEVDFDVKVDHEGNAVTVGWIYDGSTDYDMLLRKYDRTGKLLWSTTYDGPGHGYEFFGSIAIDANNNIFVVGTALNAAGNNDLTTIKYNPNGQLAWVRLYDGPGHGDDETFGIGSIGLDATGRVYVAGYQYAADGVWEYVTIKYSNSGNQLWARTYRGASGNSYGWVLAVSPGGNVYVGGDVFNPSGNRDYGLLKYDTNGNLIWDRLFDGAYHGDESLYSIAIDSAENVFGVGISDSAYLNGDFEYSCAKYDTNGNFQWEGRYGGNYGFHYGWVVLPDNAGGAYVTGATMTTGGEFDAGTVHWNSAGARTWAHDYRSQFFGDDWGLDMVLDADGNLVVAAYGWQGYGNGDDAYLLKYSPAGQLLDSVLTDGPGHGDDFWNGVDVDDAGRIVVAGSLLGAGTRADSCAAKFTTAPPPQLVIDPDPLVARRTATFTVTDFEPGSECFLAYSVQGTSSLYVPPLHVTLSLRNPRQAGNVAISDASGTAVWTLRIPNVPGANVWFQAAQYNQVSNVVATQVQ